MMKHAWGQHLVMDLRSCVPSLISCPKNVTEFSRVLVDKIDMKPYGTPWVQRFGSGNKAGLTLVQLIETSNICGHFCDDSGDAYIDIFSCKEFHQKEVEDVVHQFFWPTSMTCRMLTRGDARADHRGEASFAMEGIAKAAELR